MTLTEWLWTLAQAAAVILCPPLAVGLIVGDWFDDGDDEDLDE
jgi:hypothetical protein